MEEKVQGELQPKEVRVLSKLEELGMIIDEKVEKGEPFYITNKQKTILIMPDLRYGTIPGVSEGRVLRLPPGRTIDLLRFFEPTNLKRSMSLAEAYEKGLIEISDQPGDIVFEDEPAKPETFEAPPNVFDQKLAEFIEEEKRAEQRLIEQSRDSVARRVSRK